jgi:hypothetical protein
MTTVEKVAPLGAAPPVDGAAPHPLAVENARLAARVSELEHQLKLERSRSEGLERGLSALSERVIALRRGSGSGRQRTRGRR